MKTLIKAIEIWVPDADNQLLELAGGLYGGATAFGHLSRGMCFGRGEGLPGLAWDAQRPILLKDLGASGHFRRAAAAKAAGLSCAVAYPVFAQDQFKAVVLLFCGDVTAEVGAVELWRNDPRITPDMTLFDGYYGATPEVFQAASGETYLQRGMGLPGLAWQRQTSAYFDDLSQGDRFPRSEQAASAGIQRGLALPCPLPGRENFALNFLWPSSLPLAIRIESWRFDPAQPSPTLAYGFDETGSPLPASTRPAACGGGDDPIARAFETATPQIGAASPTSPGALALPISSDGVVTEVLALYI